MGGGLPRWGPSSSTSVGGGVSDGGKASKRRCVLLSAVACILLVGGALSAVGTTFARHKRTLQQQWPDRRLQGPLPALPSDLVSKVRSASAAAKVLATFALKF